MKLFYRKTRFIKAIVVFLIIYAVCEGALFGAVALRARAADELRQSDVIIALGCGIDETDGTPRATLALRLDRAAQLYNAGYAPFIIVTGGRGIDEPISEAESMYTYLTEAGVPSDAIIMEERASDTAENMRYSRAIMDEKGFKTAIVVTSDYHMFRAMKLADEYGLDAVGASSKNSDSFIWSVVNIARETLGWIQYVIER